MKNLVFILSILFVLNVSSQEVKINSDTEILPTSIYTSTLNKLPLLLINDKTDLASFEFLLLDINDVNNHSLSISTKNIGKKSSKYIYEAYQKIAMDKALTSAFYDLDALYNRSNCPPGRD